MQRPLPDTLPPGYGLARGDTQVFIPDWLIEAPISDTAFWVLAWIGRRDGGRPEACSELITNIGMRLGIDRTTVHRAITELIDAGYVTRHDRGKGSIVKLTGRLVRVKGPFTQIFVSAIGHDFPDFTDRAVKRAHVMDGRQFRAYVFAARAARLGKPVVLAELAAVLRNYGTSGGRARTEAKPCSPSTARRQLKDLVTRGLLVAHPVKGGPTVYFAQAQATKKWDLIEDKPGATRKSSPRKKTPQADESGPEVIHSPRQPCNTDHDRQDGESRPAVHRSCQRCNTPGDQLAEGGCQRCNTTPVSGATGPLPAVQHTKRLLKARVEDDAQLLLFTDLEVVGANEYLDHGMREGTGETRAGDESAAGEPAPKRPAPPSSGRLGRTANPRARSGELQHRLKKIITEHTTPRSHPHE